MSLKDMPDDAIECPHCGGISFDYRETRPTDRVYLRRKKGRLSPVSGDSKTPVISVVCRSCHGEYDEHELLEELAEIEG